MQTQNKLFSVFIAMGIYSFSVLGYAKAIPIIPGEYIVEGGWGHLTITQSKNKLLYSIFTMGANAHMCNLDGMISHNRSVLEGLDHHCIINFSMKGTAINVSANGDECRGYCGARAIFEGLYLKPPPICLNKNVDHKHREFKKFYDKKNYQTAINILLTVFNQCQKTIDVFTEYGIRNDLAISYYHLNQFKNCQNILAPIQKNFLGYSYPLPATEQALKELLPPTDFDNSISLAKATWHNLKLCSHSR